MCRHLTEPGPEICTTQSLLRFSLQIDANLFEESLGHESVQKSANLAKSRRCKSNSSPTPIPDPANRPAVIAQLVLHFSAKHTQFVKNGNDVVDIRRTDQLDLLLMDAIAYLLAKL